MANKIYTLEQAMAEDAETASFEGSFVTIPYVFARVLPNNYDYGLQWIVDWENYDNWLYIPANKKGAAYMLNIGLEVEYQSDVKYLQHQENTVRVMEMQEGGTENVQIEKFDFNYPMSNTGLETRLITQTKQKMHWMFSCIINPAPQAKIRIQYKCGAQQKAYIAGDLGLNYCSVATIGYEE